MIKVLKIVIVFCFILLSGCKDEELTLQRVPYIGNEIRTDGYYYSYSVNNNITPSRESIIVFFLYRNGVKLSARSYDKTDFQTLEQNMIKRYELQLPP